MTNNLVIWAILFLGVAAILFFLEIFLPSGGLIGFCAAASLVAGLVMLFKIDTTVGLVGALVAVASVLPLLMFAFRLWPNTPIARMLLLKTEPRPGLGELGVAGADSAAEAQKLVGLAGKALTDLRPVGTCLIDGRRTECLSESGVIRSGQPVRVVSADGLQVKVRADGQAT